MITRTEIELLSGARLKHRFNELSEEERPYREIHSSLSMLGKLVADELGSSSNFSLKLTSEFHPDSGIRGYIPKDLWFAVYPTENWDRLAANPQLFLIVSERGFEYGYGASVHPSDFSNALAKTAVRAAAPKVFERLPSPQSIEAEELTQEINNSGEWSFARKHRLPPGNSDFRTLDDWLAYLHSADHFRQ